MSSGCRQAGRAGNSGSKGDSGDPGSSGYDALQAKAARPAVLVSLPDLVDEQGNPYIRNRFGQPTELPAGKTRTLGSVDLSAYFAGGQPPVAYRVTGLDAVPVEGTVETGQFAYRVAVPAAGFYWVSDEGPYRTGWTATIAARDAKAIEAQAPITFKMNRAPWTGGHFGAAQKTASSGTIAQPPPVGAFLLGTSTAEREEPLGTKTPLAHRTGVHMACPKYHECQLDGFRDDDPIMVTVEQMTRRGAATTDHVGHAPVAYVPSSLHHSLFTPGTNLKLIGLKSTWDPTAGVGHVPVQVDVKATDSKGLGATVTVWVAVDQAPMVSDAGRSLVQGKTFTVDENDEVIHTRVGAMFRDIESSTLTYSGVTTDAAVATIDSLSSATTAITVDPVGIGSATLKVTARDERHQTVELEFTVNVTNIP